MRRSGQQGKSPLDFINLCRVRQHHLNHSNISELIIHPALERLIPACARISDQAWQGFLDTDFRRYDGGLAGKSHQLLTVVEVGFLKPKRGTIPLVGDLTGASSRVGFADCVAALGQKVVARSTAYGY